MDEDVRFAKDVPPEISMGQNGNDDAYEIVVGLTERPDDLWVRMFQEEGRETFGGSGLPVPDVRMGTLRFEIRRDDLETYLDVLKGVVAATNQKYAPAAEEAERRLERARVTLDNWLSSQ
jgi:hypothetical protein